MATGIDKLRDKFRGLCAERIVRIRTLLKQNPALDSAELRDVLSELHTLKGESAMVGFANVSQLAHSLEDLLAAGRRTQSLPQADVLEALRILHLAVQQPSEHLLRDPEIEDLLQEVRAAVTSLSATEVQAEPRSAPPRRTGSTPATVESKRSSQPARRDPIPAQTSVRWIRVDSEIIERVCERLSETALQMGQVRNDLSRAVSKSATRESARELNAIRQQLEAAQSSLDEVTTTAWSLRLVPLAPALDDLMAHACALAASSGKQLEIEVLAEGAELERGLLEELQEPLLHLVRNAIDHGIEPSDKRGSKPAAGRLRCTAETQGSQLLLCVEDDGQGMEPQRIRDRAVQLELLSTQRAPLLSPEETLDLIFLPGFTERDIADSLSGRGLGLSAARRKVEGLGGALRVQSTPGLGTRFELSLPSTISKEPVLIVDAGGAQYGIPARWVLTAIRSPEALRKARQDRVCRYQDEPLPVRSLADWLGLSTSEASALLVVEIAQRRGAILVERIVGEQHLLRRPADRLLSGSGRIVSSGTAEDGSLVLLLRWAEVLRDSTTRRADLPTSESTVRQPRVLVVDDSPVVRDIVADILANAGLAVDTVDNGAAALERLQSGGIDLVLTDVEMPRMDGFELLERIRQRTEMLPIVLLTTRSSPEDRRRAASLGANAYVVKSEFEGSTLLDVVGRFLERRG